MPIYDHTVGSTFSSRVPKPAPGIDEIHIDPMIDGAGFAVCGEYLRVDVFPPNTDPDMPGAFIAVCENNLSAEQARFVATLLLAAADFVEYLDQKQVPQSCLQRILVRNGVMVIIQS